MDDVFSSVGMYKLASVAVAPRAHKKKNTGDCGHLDSMALQKVYRIFVASIMEQCKVFEHLCQQCCLYAWWL
jgi:hypothetical protein